MTVRYYDPNGQIVTLASPGIFYDCLPEYSTEELLAELQGRRRQYLETPANEPERLPNIPFFPRRLFKTKILAHLKEELRRRGIDPGEEWIVE